MKWLLTAGHDGARHVLAMAEGLRRAGQDVQLLVVSPFGRDRITSLLRRRGARALAHAARRALRGDTTPSEWPVEQLLEQLGVTERSLGAYAAARSLRLDVVRSLETERCLGIVRNSGARGVLYGGGGILRQDFLEAADRCVLNAHSGPLPGIRGMNAAEWSVLLGRPLTVTIHLIDEGIDTGPTLATAPVPLQPGDTVERLRERFAATGARAIVQTALDLPDPLPPPGPRPRTRQCFVLAPALREVLDLRLQDQA